MLAYESTILPVILLLRSECLWLKSLTFGIRKTNTYKNTSDHRKLGIAKIKLD